jgi:hypothetical protein
MAKPIDKYKQLILTVLAGLVFLSGCEKDIHLELKEGGGRLVLFSFLVPDSVFSVHLSRSVGYSSIDDFERVYDGYIKVYQNETLVDAFDYPFRDLWAQREQVNVRAGDSYMVQAGDASGNVVSGSVTIPVAVPIEQLDTVRVLSPDDRGVLRTYIDCSIIFSDPGQEKNYYQLLMAEEFWDKNGTGTKYSYQLVNFIKQDPVFYIRDQEGSLLGGIDFKGTFHDELFNGKEYHLQIRIPGTYVVKPEVNQKRRLTFMLLSQSRDYFDYLRSRVVAEYNYEIPIVDPIKIHSNVDGGLGLVGGISVSADSLVFNGGTGN